LALENEDILNLFTRDELGNLYFDGRLLLQWDTVAPEPVTNIEVTNLTLESVSISFDPSASDDVSHYKVQITYPASATIKELTTSDTNVDITGLSLQELEFYEIYVFVVDTSGNESESKMYTVLIPPSNKEQAPVVSRASISTSLGEDYALIVNLKNFFFAETLDVYVQGEFKGTITGSNGSYNCGVPEYRGVTEIVVIAKNQYGESRRSVNTYWDY